MALYEVYEEIKVMILQGLKNMNWRKFFMNLFIIVLVIAALMGGCAYLNKVAGVKDDNVVEEAIEEKIKYETGIDIDLTPHTPEGDKMYPIYQHELS